MTKFILHGGFTREANELNDRFYQEFVKDLKEGGTVLFVYFAREKDEYQKLFKQDSTRVLETVGEKKLNAILAEEENFIEQVKNADALFLRGGDTDKLKNTIKKYKEFPKAIEGKVVAGSSAGAYLFSTFHGSASFGGVHEGLGILPIRLICHYKSQSGIFDHVGEKELEEIKKYPDHLELVVLKDFESKVFTK